MTSITNTCNCTFCEEFSGSDQAYFFQLANRLDYPYADRVVASTQNFIALAGLGAITKAYLLILPRAHYLAMGALPPLLASEFLDFKSRLWYEMEARFGAVISFEHGPASSELKAGCCVEHAHLHLMAPCHMDPHALLMPYFDLIEANDWNVLQSLHLKKLPYIYFQDNCRNGFASVTPQRLPSQFMRQIIAGALGESNWDWRQCPRMDRVANIYQHFINQPMTVKEDVSKELVTHIGQD